MKTKRSVWEPFFGFGAVGQKTCLQFRNRELEGQDAKSAKVSGMFFSYIKVHVNDKMKQKLYEIFTFDNFDTI